MILAHIPYTLRYGCKIDSFLITFVVEMVKQIWTFHGRMFCGRTFGGQGVSFPDLSGPESQWPDVLWVYQWRSCRWFYHRCDRTRHKAISRYCPFKSLTAGVKLQRLSPYFYCGFLWLGDGLTEGRMHSGLGSLPIMLLLPLVAIAIIWKVRTCSVTRCFLPLQFFRKSSLIWNNSLFIPSQKMHYILMMI